MYRLVHHIVLLIPVAMMGVEGGVDAVKVLPILAGFGC